MSDKHQEYMEQKQRELSEYEFNMQERKIELLTLIDRKLDRLNKHLEEISSNLILVKLQDARINDLQAHVAGLNRTITFLKNTGKFPKEEK